MAPNGPQTASAEPVSNSPHGCKQSATRVQAAAETAETASSNVQHQWQPNTFAGGMFSKHLKRVF